MFSILTEPLSSFWTFTCFENIKKRACRTNIASHEQALQEGESVPPSVEETIRSFIRDVCRLDSTNIAIRASEESSLPSTRGSLVYGNRPIIYIPLRYVKQITEEFTSSHQFAIAHECGHLAFDDWCVGMIQQEKAAALARLCGYGVTVALASQVFSSWLAVHLMGCTAAKICRIIATSLSDQTIEQRADLYAAALSEDIRKGGIYYLTALQEMCRDAKNSQKGEAPSILTTLRFTS